MDDTLPLGHPTTKMLFGRERSPGDNFHNLCHEDNPLALTSFKVAQNKEAVEDESGAEENPGPLSSSSTAAISGATTLNRKNKPNLTLALGSLSEMKTFRRHSLGRPARGRENIGNDARDEEPDGILMTPLSTSRLTASTRARRFSDTCTNIHQQLLYVSPFRTPDFSPSPSSGSSFRARGTGSHSSEGSFRGDSTAGSLSPPKDAVGHPPAIVPSEITWKDVRQCFAASCTETVSEREFRLRRERFLAAWTLCALKDNPQRGSTFN